MPTIDFIGPYRFFFYSSDGGEPAHVHVRRERFTAKFWLEPVLPANSNGFSDRELLRIQQLVQRNQALFLEKWHDYFDA
ncbi:MAG: DUF4160 domain-containing protein [Planctomycetota bacterium]